MKEKERNSNFELLRIVCMIMIVLLHTLGHGGLLENLSIKGKEFIIANIIESLSIVAVNCYILITGYFSIYSKFQIRKIKNLYGQVLFYSISLSLLFLILKLENISLQFIFNSIFPIITQVWWFISIYFALYLLLPYINKLLLALNKVEFKNLILILFLIFIVWPSMRVISVIKPISLDSGYSLYNFILLYMVGAYIRIFYNKEINRYYYILTYLLSTSVVWIGNILISYTKGEYWPSLLKYDFIFVFIASISLFMFFKSIDIKSKLINRIASLTLGVYLIHDHIYVKKYLYKFLNYDKYFFTDKIYIYTLLLVAVIFIFSCIIELIRKNIFSKIRDTIQTNKTYKEIN